MRTNRYDVPDTTLQDKVRFFFAHDAAKHGVQPKGMSPAEWADKQIDKMSNSEFLAALSHGLEERLSDNEL
jgi:hypothetical protein